MEERYINVFTDFGFKKLFGEEANKDLLIDFLNSLLSKQDKIVDLTFKKTEHLGSTELNRKAIFDLYCIDEKGQRFIVELQKAEQKFFKDRSVYYSSFPIQEQAKKGDWNYKLEPVYCIGILDFSFTEDKDFPDKYLYNVGLVDFQTNKLFYDKLFYIYIEVPKFKKTVNELNTNIEKWVYFLKNLSRFEEIPERLRTEMFMKAFEIAEIANFTEEQRIAYDQSIKYYRDLKNSIDKSFEDGKIEGKIEGFEQGKSIGLEEGKSIGIHEGELNKSKSVLLKILHKKFTDLDKAITNKIESIMDINVIDQLIDKCFDITDIQQLKDIIL